MVSFWLSVSVELAALRVTAAVAATIAAAAKNDSLIVFETFIDTVDFLMVSIE